MNEQQFMELLDYYFRNVDSYVYEEIKKDYLEHFRLGRESGKTEEEISRELGSPKDIYQEYKESDLIDEKSVLDFSGIMDMAQSFGKLFTKQDVEKEEFIQEEVLFDNKYHRIEVKVNTNISITSEERDTIEVVYHKTDDEYVLPIKEEGHVLKIGNLDVNRIVTKKSPLRSLYIKLPKQSDLGINIASISGNVKINVGNNDVSIKTMVGDISVESEGEGAFINTASGNVTVSGIRKQVKIISAAGNISVEGDRPKMDLNTTTGQVNVTVNSIEKSDIRTVNGNVDMNIREKDMKLHISTVSGDINLEGKYVESSKTFGKSFTKAFSDAQSNLSIHTVSGDVQIQ